MKRAVLAVGFVLLVHVIWGQPKTTLKVVGELGPEMKTALAYQGIGFEVRGAVTLIETERRDDLVRLLATLLADEQMRLDVISNNIANAETTKTADGVPYRRQEVVCGPDGFINSVREVKEEFNWVYEPGHPDAMKDGPRTGYVAKPNVDLLREQTDFATHERTIQSLEIALRRLEPDLIVCLPRLTPKAPTSRPVDFLSPDMAASSSGSQGKKALNIEELLRSAAENWSASEVVVQSNAIASGQACVAMAVNRLTCSQLQDRDIDRLYGFQLLKALKKETASRGCDWRDAGDIDADSHRFLTPILEQGLPVILALNGPFDPSGQNRGHIVLLESTDGDEVTYVDPWDGERKKTTWDALAKAPAHPDGNFLFVPYRNGGPFMSPASEGML